MPPATTTEPTVTDLLDENASDAISVGRLIDDTRGRLDQIGHRGAPGDPSRGIPATPATGQIGAELRGQIAAHTDAATTGRPANVVESESAVAALEAEHDRLDLVLRGAGQRLRSLASARPVIVREHHDALVVLAHNAVEDGQSLLAAAALATTALERHRATVVSAVDLAAAGAEDNDVDRKALLRSFAPWVGAAPASNALWESVARLASTPAEVKS
jgi:hypothetical protein